MNAPVEQRLAPPDQPADVLGRMPPRRRVGRLARYIGKDKRTIDKHVGDSELFELVSGPSSAVIRRRR